VVHNIHGNTIYYDGSHVRRLDYDTQSQSLADIYVSSPLRGFFESIPNDQRYATSSYAYPLLKFFLRRDHTSKSNDIAVVYNVETRSWSIQDQIQVQHAWSGYDERNDKWNGFFGSPYQNQIYKDND
jgi:hypothetical protein